MGIVGVAWGTLIPSLSASMLFCHWYLRHTLGVPLRRYAIAAWLKPGFAVLPFALSCYSVEHYWPAHNLLFVFRPDCPLLANGIRVVPGRLPDSPRTGSIHAKLLTVFGRDAALGKAH
jgi:hypothetical protein